MPHKRRNHAPKLGSSAYLIDHDVDLDAQSLLFGAFKTYQRSILAIEGLTNLDFGSLHQFDGFSNGEKATATLSGH